MQLDDGFALRDGVQNLGDTVRNVVFHYVFDEQSGYRDTYHWSDEIQPMMLLYEM
jgi:hypothetical protein